MSRNSMYNRLWGWEGGCKSHHSEHVYQAQQVCVVGGGARATILSMYTRCVCGEGGGY